MSQSWLELSADFRRAASVLALDGGHRSAVSRAYYAAYAKVAHDLVVIAGLPMAGGREGPGHAGLRRIIESSMPNMNEDRRRKLSEMIGRLYTQRIDADYHPSVLVDAYEARRAITLMNKIFNVF